jgi:hypothetical protein
MPGVFDTLIEIRTDVSEAEEISKVRSEICALYPWESSTPNFQVTEVVEHDGKKFLRLTTMVGSMHFMLRRAVKLKTLARTLLCATDRDSPDYQYFS